MTDIEAMSSVIEAGETTTTEEILTPNADANVSQSDAYSLVLTKQDFVKFTSVLGIISNNICNDCDIQNGKIRCRTNDRKNMILMDLTSIIGERNIAFSALKNKLSLLSTFNFVSDYGSDNGITVEANESNFEFSDSVSKLVTRRPVASYLENLYLTDEEFAAINNSINREDAVLFNVTINGMEKKRIAKLCEIFCSNTVTFNFMGNTANYITQTPSKDNVSKTSQSIALMKNLADKKTLINNLAFVLDTTSDLTITCYQIGEEYCIFKSELTYDNTIPIQIYTKSRIVDSGDDE